jgi:ribonuclease HI
MKPFVFTLRVDSIETCSLECHIWNGSEENRLRYWRENGAVTFSRENGIARGIVNNQHQLKKILSSAIDGKLHVGQTINCVFLENFHFLKNDHFNKYIRIDRRLGKLNITTSDTGMPHAHKIYADGSCNHETSQSGYGGFVETPNGKRELFFQPFSGGSSNLMELLAVVEGLQRLSVQETIQINTDSRFVIRGLVQWVHFWRHNSWQTAYGRDVRYAAHWQQAATLCEGKHLEFKWLKGHSGNQEQDICHLLAKAAAAKASPRQ